MKALEYSLQFYIPTLVKAEGSTATIKLLKCQRCSSWGSWEGSPSLWATWGQPPLVPWDSHCSVRSLELSLQQNEEMFLHWAPCSPWEHSTGREHSSLCAQQWGCPAHSCATSWACQAVPRAPGDIELSFFLQGLDYGEHWPKKVLWGYFFQFSF